MKKWMFEMFFGKLIPFKWINGHKTEIARGAALISGVLLVVQQVFPQYIAIITQGQAMLATLLSLLGVEIGKIHKEIKAEKK